MFIYIIYQTEKDTLVHYLLPTAGTIVVPSINVSKATLRLEPILATPGGANCQVFYSYPCREANLQSFVVFAHFLSHKQRLRP